MSFAYRIAVGIALILYISSASFAQTNGQTTLKGVVTDPSGALIPGATVQLRGPAGEQTQTTDANGQYTFTGVRNGTYDIQISAPDFKTDQRQGVNINGATTLDVQLALQVQSQVVNVQEEAAAVSLEPDANASATVLGKTELDSLSDDPD